MQSSTLQFIRKFIKVYRPFAWTFAAALVLTAVISAFALVPPYLQGKVVDAQKMGMFAKTVLFIALTGASMLSMGLVSVARDIFQNRKLEFELQHFSSQITLSKVFSLSIGQHLNQHSGITQSIVTNGEHSMNALMFTILFEILPTLATMIVVSIALLVTAPLMGAVTMLGIAIFAAKLIRNNLVMRAKLKELNKRRIRFSKQESEVFQHASLVISAVQEDRTVEECGQDLATIHSFAKSLWDRYLKRWGLLHVILVSTWISASLLAAWFVQTGRYTIGFMVMIWWWFSQIETSAGRVGWMLRQVLQLYPPIAKYFELLDTETDVEVVPSPVRPDHYEGRIEFRNVVMRYRARPSIEDEEDEDEGWSTKPVVLSKDPALAGVSFTINAGERVAIVGESGAGKTTIVHALLRAQDPEEGQILIDGHDLRILDPKHFRGAIGLVEQQAALFDRSLRYNITFGLNEQRRFVTESELEDVAKLACIDRFMENLTNGFDTLVGERGVRLSGGERQRVAIARALIKKPSILIFDEATSNLDPQNELAIREAIEQASVGRTTIIIAHRFSTIRNVDKVIVLDKGKIVGIGSHEELEQTCEFYQRLVRPQLASVIPIHQVSNGALFQMNNALSS